jgi:Ser/Thr protein kinase RdoA (MazF antagonist)
LQKKYQLYTYRHQTELVDVWVVFYNPIGVDQMLPKRLQANQIEALGRQLAEFHRACASLTNILPDWSKTLRRDMDDLASWLEQPEGQFHHRGNISAIQEQMALFEHNTEALGAHAWQPIPVFIDWNIGNFSVTQDLRFFSRWDYDWFRMSSRVFDFYFFSRVCSRAGDKSVFSYDLNTLFEDGFIRFLSAYHEVYPLTREELEFLPEAYRFFILNYVIKYGRYFFQDVYASKLEREAFTRYFPQLQKGFDVERLAKACGV